MKQIPDIAIVVDPNVKRQQLQNVVNLGITIISILDTNCDPNVVDIPIPANDDAVRSIKLIISTLIRRYYLLVNRKTLASDIKFLPVITLYYFFNKEFRIVIFFF